MLKEDKKRITPIMLVCVPLKKTSAYKTRTQEPLW